MASVIRPAAHAGAACDQLRFDYELQGPMFRDPAFMKNRQVPIHSWVPWVAGFSASFVDDCITAFLDGTGATVLDPFAGVGTTLISALRAGHNAVGFEINPYAALACRAKADAVHVNLRALRLAVHEYECRAQGDMRTAGGQKPPAFESRIPFFSPRIEEQVHGFFAFVSEVEDEEIANVLKVAFGSVMVGFSNYTYEPSLGTRPGAGKPLIEDADVHATVISKLHRMLADIEWLQREAPPEHRTAQVHCMSFMDSAAVMEEDSVDLAVTSPPYLNNYHYIRSTRPHLYWLGLLADRADLRKLEEENVGKYWQTVRGQAPIDLQFEESELEVVLDAIRSTRQEKGVYGGAGWANYVASYFNDSALFLSSLARVLKPGAHCVIVVGNSIIQGHEVKVEQVLGRMSARHGLDLTEIRLLRSKRVGASITKSSVRRGGESAASLYESAVILRRSAT